MGRVVKRALVVALLLVLGLLWLVYAADVQDEGSRNCSYVKCGQDSGPPWMNSPSGY